MGIVFMHVYIMYEHLYRYVLCFAKQKRIQDEWAWFYVLLSLDHLLKLSTNKCCNSYSHDKIDVEVSLYDWLVGK